jgi:hypothetical protein
VARRPLERERIGRDGGRRTTQLMRDPLGSAEQQRTMPNIEKDSTILDLLDRLATEFGVGAFGVVDHWDAGLCAIGIAQPGTDRPLLYVCTWQKEPGRYYADVELPPETGSEHPYEQGPEFADISFSELIVLLDKHVGIRRTGPLSSGAA